MNRQASRMRYYLAALSAVGVLLLSACGGVGHGGGGTSTTVSRTIGSPTQNVTGFISDAAADNVASLKMDVSNVKVLDGNGNATVLDAGPEHIEFAHLALAPTTAFSTPLGTGTYKTLTFTVANPQLNVTDSAGKVTLVTPASSPSVSLKSATVTIPLTLSVASNTNNGLIVDFDAATSLSQDASGNYIIDPKFSISATSDTSSSLEVVDSLAKISALGKSPNSMDVVLNDTGQTIHVVVGSDAVFDSVLQNFGNLQVGQTVAVSAKYQSSNNQYAAKFISSGASDPKLSSYGLLTVTKPQPNGTAVVGIVVQR